MADGYNATDLGHVALTVNLAAVTIPRVQEPDGNGGLKVNARNQPIYCQPNHALIYVKGQPIRWRADGIAVNSGDGMGTFVPAGAYIDWTAPLVGYWGIIQRVQFIRDATATGPAVLDITFFT